MGNREAMRESGLRDHRGIFLSVLLIFTIWRGALFAFDFVGTNLTDERSNNQNKDYQAFPDNYVLDGWCRWDSGWYMRIAEKGYFIEGPQSDVAFFPLFPYLSRLLGTIFGNNFLGGLVLSNVSTLLGLFFLYLIGLEFLPEDMTRRATILALLFPTSFFLSAYYSEGLFLLAATASTFFFMRKHYVAAGAAGMLAMLTRSTGIVLFIAFAAATLIEVLRKRERLSWPMLGLLLIPAGLLVFMAMLEAQVGDPWSFFQVQHAWGRGVMFPLLTPFKDLADVDFSFPRSADNMQLFLDSAASIAYLIIAALMIHRRYPPVLWLLTFGWVLMPLSSGATVSMGRFGCVMFPVFLLLSEICEDRATERFVVFAFAFFLSLYNLRFINWYWAG